MTNLRQAAEMALEALEFSQKMGRSYEIREYHNEIAPQAMYALRQALNQSPETTKMMGLIPSEWAGLAEPPKREWVGLAGDELPALENYQFTRGVRWAEAKLKEKNT
jgi:hypothetical protein